MPVNAKHVAGKNVVKKRKLVYTRKLMAHISIISSKEVSIRYVIVLALCVPVKGMLFSLYIDTLPAQSLRPE